MGPDADPAPSALEMIYFGALVQAGSGAVSYYQIADRLTDVVGLILGEDNVTEPREPVTSDQRRVLDPYDYEIHEDPYPIYRGCATRRRCTATTSSASGRCRATPTCCRASATRRASRTAHGVSLDPVVARPARAQDDVVPGHGPPAHLRMRALVSRGLHAAPGRRARAAHPRARRAAPRRRCCEAGRIRLHRRLRRQAADGRDLRADRRARGRPATLRRLADRVVHREEGVHDVPPAGMRGRARPGRLLRRHGRRAPQAADRRPHSALLDAEIDGDRLTDDEIIGSCS